MSDATLLAELDDYAWDGLSHAYGPASDVPDLLRALVWPERASAAIVKAAGTKPVREHVMWTLWGNVVHQGTVWEVTPHVIPFLVEILRDGPRDAPLQQFLIDYLRHLALGFPEDVFPEIVDPDIYFALADEPAEDPDDPCDGTKLCAYARECYRRVEAALPTIAPFVESKDRDVAYEAIALLATFRSSAATAGLRPAATHADLRRRVIALVALAHLDAATVRTHATPLLDDTDPFTVVHAAAALSLCGPADLTPRVLEVLTAPLGPLTEESSPMTNTVGKLVSGCLALLPKEHLENVVTALGAGLASAAPTTNLAASGSLLQLVFGEDRAPSSASALTPLQRRALAYIAAHGAFDFEHGEFGNYVLMMRNWGLPGTRKELRTWLS